MAFENTHLSHVGGSPPAPQMYTYVTDDDRTVVLADNYFHTAFTKLRVKDMISVVNGDDMYTVKVVTSSKDGVTTEKAAAVKKEYAFFYVNGPEAIDVDDDGTTYTHVTDMTLDPAFEFSQSNGTLTYTGHGGKFLFNGSSDFGSNRSADITIALAINDVIAPQAITYSFNIVDHRGNAAKTGILTLNTNDTIKVMVKGDGTNNTTVTLHSLSTTFVEI